MVGVPPLPTLPPVDGVVDELNGDGVTGGEGGNVVQPIGDTSSCVVFDRNTKCGGVAGKGVGDRFLSVSLYRGGCLDGCFVRCCFVHCWFVHC